MKKFKFKIEGVEYEAEVNDVEDNVATVNVNGKLYTVELEKEEVVKSVVRKRNPASVAADTSKAASQAAPKAPTGSGALVAPLPGTILSIAVTPGQQVKTGEIVLAMESMKMENNILADADGTIKNVFVKVGQSVMQGDTLVEIA